MTIKATLLIRITLQKYAGSTPKQGSRGNQEWRKTRISFNLSCLLEWHKGSRLPWNMLTGDLVMSCLYCIKEHTYSSTYWYTLMQGFHKSRKTHVYLIINATHPTQWKKPPHSQWDNLALYSWRTIYIYLQTIVTNSWHLGLQNRWGFWQSIAAII